MLLAFSCTFLLFFSRFLFFAVFFCHCGYWYRVWVCLAFLWMGKYYWV